MYGKSPYPTRPDMMMDQMDQSMMQPGTMQPGMMQPGMMQPGMIQPGMMQPGMMQPGMMQPGMMQPGMMQPGMMQPGMMQPGMMQPPMMQMPSVIGRPSAEQSYVENILRMNRGKIATIYTTNENNPEWPAKIFKGRVENAARDHVVLSDPQTGMRYMILMVNIDYITFDEPLNYEPSIYGTQPQ